MLGGLLIAWILTLFNFDNVFIGAMKELFNLSITIYSYYFIFGMLGFILKRLRKTTVVRYDIKS
jgi:hypothetical protein